MVVSPHDRGGASLAASLGMTTAALGAAAAGKVWLRTEDGRYVQMTEAARETVLKNHSTRGLDVDALQVDPHGLPLPAAHEDETERAKVAAHRALLTRQDADNAASVEVYLAVGQLPVEHVHVAQFGPRAAHVAAPAVLAEPRHADSLLSNAAQLQGNVALVERGHVSFVEKARRAQQAGAIALIIINSDDTPYVPLGMQGDDEVLIPVVCVRRRDGAVLTQANHTTLISIDYGNQDDESIDEDDFEDDESIDEESQSESDDVYGQEQSEQRDGRDATPVCNSDPTPPATGSA